MRLPVIMVAKQPCFLNRTCAESVSLASSMLIQALQQTTSATPALKERSAINLFCTLLPAAATGVGAAGAAARRKLRGWTRCAGPRRAEARARQQRTRIGAFWQRQRGV